MKKQNKKIQILFQELNYYQSIRDRKFKSNNKMKHNNFQVIWKHIKPSTKNKLSLL